MSEKSVLKRARVDLSVTITVVGLVLFGIVMIYSASVILGYTVFHDPQYFFKKQIISAIIGFCAMIACASIDYHFWRRWAGIMLAFTIVLLVAVFFLTRGEINGAHRWIQIGSLSFQPSELAKLTFLMYISGWLASREEQISDFAGTFIPFMAILGSISFLLLKQPDFGTLAIFFSSAVAVYLVAGMTWKQAVAGFGVVGVALTAILAEPYRRDRIMTFLSPTADQSGTGWHVTNIAYSIGSGGWFGLGFGNSGQKRLFLPEPHTDSIFAIVTEELGFVVASLVILAFIFLAYRGYRVALRSTDTYGRLLAVGITSWFVFQAFLNLASMAHIIPLVGVPLPFISYGGTNLAISLAAIGVLLNISRQGRDVVPDEPAAAPKRRVASASKK